MSLVQLLVMLVVAGLVTPPFVLFIPRARRSAVFDRVIWAATWLLAFLGAWVAPSYIGTDAALNGVVVAEVSLIPALIGAVAGALSINLLLWLLDRFDRPPIEENPTVEGPGESEQENIGTGSSDSNEHKR